MKKILCLLCLTITLQACVPSAFVAGTVASSVLYDNRTKKTILDDRNITFQIKRHFNKKKLNFKSNISATSFNHIVLILGQANTVHVRTNAEKIVKSYAKVKFIHNEITVEKPISKLDRINDALITTKVKFILATTTKLNSSTLKIITENKVVYLMGLTTFEQAKMATEKASTVPGIKKIVKLFEYID